jgi:uncharacterized protein YciI
MRLIIIFSVILIISKHGYLMAQDNKEPGFEMKTYFFVFLKKVATRPVLDSAKASEIQAGHLNHIMQMFKDGKCRLSGPFLDDGEIRGILILDVSSEEEAKELCSKDPAVINGRLIPEIKPWYGPANIIIEKSNQK